MNITSIFRDTVNQLTTGAGKAINSVVDFFSSLRSGITGIFNSNTSFRQVAIDPSLINYNDPGKTSHSNLQDFLHEKCGVNTTEGRVNREKDNIENNIYEEPIYNTINEEPIYDTINEYFLDLIIKPSESRNENKSSAVEEEYSSVIDSIAEPSEDIYTLPYDHVLSDKDLRDTLPTGNENIELGSFSPKDKTKFNTI
ncbi:hypothetical protein [Proteus terrae]|uniref:hypothetical protein n=1 Tax=Proteus terrae TaxID=1574161 RepID=UPI0018C47FA3|nr:hypothetical protein [Proteus terrae]MBG2837657.1 hypothetical protein [Proteus terrae subsp. cibarius]MBG2868028.1 hypothetical protein [Proteus terrae subsp. cibarius]